MISRPSWPWRSLVAEQPARAAQLLVTGAGGFVGKHVRAAVEAGAFGRYSMASIPANFEIRDEDQTDSLIADTQPDAVIHLAAQSFVPRSFEDPRGTLETNLIGTLNVLRALSRVHFAGRLLYVSSGDVFGLVPDGDLPVTEALKPKPRSPYAVSKIAAEELCLQWLRAHRLDVVIARPFNHIGPGQAADFAIPSFARQIIEIERGDRPAVLDVGDIDTTRDFTDVRDVVAAYAKLLQCGKSGSTYLIGSGVEYRMRDLIGLMCEACHVSPEIRQDPARMRPAEQRRMVADASLLRGDTGWKPKYTMKQTLDDVLNDARGRA